MAAERAPQSVEEWEASLPPCDECGRRMDALDHIEGRSTCVACELDLVHGSDDLDDFDEDAPMCDACGDTGVRPGGDDCLSCPPRGEGGDV